jgi:hypothetical protein
MVVRAVIYRQTEAWQLLREVGGFLVLNWPEEAQHWIWLAYGTRRSVIHPPPARSYQPTALAASRIAASICVFELRKISILAIGKFPVRSIASFFERADGIEAVGCLAHSGCGG